MVTVIPVVVGFAVMAAAAVGDTQVAATATSQAGRASPQQSPSPASGPSIPIVPPKGYAVELWSEADQAIQVWQDETNALHENNWGPNGYYADCADDEHNAEGHMPDAWFSTEMDGKNLKEQAKYNTTLLKPYQDSMVKLLDVLRDRWPHGSAKWGKVEHAATNISAALLSYTNAMKEYSNAGDRYIAHDCNGAKMATTKVYESLLSGLHKLKIGMAEAKVLVQQA